MKRFWITHGNLVPAVAGIKTHPKITTVAISQHIKDLVRP